MQHCVREGLLKRRAASVIATQCPLASRLLSFLAFVNFDDIFHALFDPARDGEK
jgi:hypothetical protein